MSELPNHEAIKKLFHPKVVEHAKRVAHGDERPEPPATKQS
ncbi:MAG TPA: hypothetical protein VFC93_16335 [Chloroflexota bacterium]|nr:hypothetical protein [Chloroflexota bacterium]